MLDLKSKYPWIGAVALGVAVAVLSSVTLRILAPVLPPPPPGYKAANGKVYSFGYLATEAPKRAADAAKQLSHPEFAKAGAGLLAKAARSEDKDALLYEAAIKATGALLPAHDQNGTGCCVGDGSIGAVEVLDCIHAAISGNKYKPLSSAFQYGVCREIGKYPRNSEGATGHDAAIALAKVGTVDGESAGDDSSKPHPHADLAREWGRNGVPKQLKDIAKDHKIQSVSCVRTPEEARAALQNRYPLFICSDVGFEGGRNGFERDKDGFCYEGGQWPHCMYVCAYRADKRAFLVIQSWGPNVPPGPRTLNQPDNSFWIKWETMAKILRQGDSYAVSDHDGFPAQELPWFVQRKPERKSSELFARFNRMLSAN